MDTKKKSMLELHRLSVDEFRHTAKTPLAVVLDSVRSLNNVGSIFRTADAFVVEQVCLCGITATPPHPDIHKTALGAEDAVAWSHYDTVGQCVDTLRAQGYTICAIEQAHNSVSLERFQADDTRRYAVVFGHEVRGVAQEVVDTSDYCIEIPQCGTKHSLNVAISAGIVMWHFFRQLRLKI